jgi:threonine/homoserine/homoserine lactone efflux protein
MLFFLGLFTLLLKPTTPLSVELIIGAEIFLLTLGWFAFLSIMITHKAIKNKIGAFQYYITKCMGLLLILFGIGMSMVHPH